MALSDCKGERVKRRLGRVINFSSRSLMFTDVFFEMWSVATAIVHKVWW